MVFNSKMNEVVSYVNMFGTCMIATIFGKCNSRLTVQVERDWMSEWAEDFSNESSKP